MRTKTVKRTGKIRQVKKPEPFTIVLDEQKIAEILGKYTVRVSFNLRTFECETNDIKAAILSFKPENIATEMYLTIQKGEALFEKRFNLVQARKLFNDEETLDMLLNTYNSLYNG